MRRTHNVKSFFSFVFHRNEEVRYGDQTRWLRPNSFSFIFLILSLFIFWEKRINANIVYQVRQRFCIRYSTAIFSDFIPLFSLSSIWFCRKWNEFCGHKHIDVIYSGVYTFQYALLSDNKAVWRQIGHPKEGMIFILFLYYFYNSFQ